MARCKRGVINENLRKGVKKEPVLTCFAIPKSANLTTPNESTSKLAPLMSLSTDQKKYAFK
jgi:hypothetical protein